MEDAAACLAAYPELASRAQLLGIHLSDRQRDEIVEYCGLLLATNRHTNLTAIRSAPGVMRELFLDALTLVSVLPAPMARPDAATRLVDVGSGAGFPGLPLKILFPPWSVLLVESVGKKARFLEQVVAALQLSDVTVLNERAEEVGKRKDRREASDVCVARAVAALPTLLELCAPLVRVGGLLVFPKGSDAAEEIQAARVAERRLGLKLLDVVPLSPELEVGGGHHVVTYAKIAPTPAWYPRRVGLARSRPIA